MRGWLSFLYGVAAYVAGLAALVYLVGFCADLIVPRSVDVGPSAPIVHAVVVDLLLVAAFGLQHSVMARRGFKRRWTRIVPPAIERSTYLLGTCAVLALLFRFWLPIPTPIVWKLEHGAAPALVWALFCFGWLLALVSTFLIDHFELFGLRQATARLLQRAVPEGRFRTPFLYRHVRHPLYAGLLLAFWSAPVMTTGRLLFAAACTAYILVGVAFEERDLLRQFGERYRAYRDEVGMLVPRLRRLRPPRSGPPDAARPHSG